MFNTKKIIYTEIVDYDDLLVWIYVYHPYDYSPEDQLFIGYEGYSIFDIKAESYDNANKILTTMEWLNSIIANISYDSISYILLETSIYKRNRRNLAGYYCLEYTFYHTYSDIDDLIDNILNDLLLPSDKAFAYECARLYGIR